MLELILILGDGYNIIYIYVFVDAYSIGERKGCSVIFRNGEQMEESQDGFRKENVSLCSGEVG